MSFSWFWHMYCLITTLTDEKRNNYIGKGGETDLRILLEILNHHNIKGGL
jgi:hypothetical protein